MFHVILALIFSSFLKTTFSMYLAYIKGYLIVAILS